MKAGHKRVGAGPNGERGSLFVKSGFPIDLAQEDSAASRILLRAGRVRGARTLARAPGLPAWSIFTDSAGIWVPHPRRVSPRFAAANG
jgi:hypothetical protein